MGCGTSIVLAPTFMKLCLAYKMQFQTINLGCIDYIISSKRYMKIPWHTLHFLKRKDEILPLAMAHVFEEQKGCGFKHTRCRHEPST